MYAKDKRHRRPSMLHIVKLTVRQYLPMESAILFHRDTSKTEIIRSLSSVLIGFIFYALLMIHCFKFILSLFSFRMLTWLLFLICQC